MNFLVTPAPNNALQFVKFLDYLQRREKHALGFLPFQALEQAIERGRVLLCFENGEPAGYCIHGPAKAEGKIYQVVICDDSRRIEHGTALVEAVKMRMNTGKAEMLSLHCAEDLEANKFWAQIGFTKTGTRCKRKDRRRHQNRYELVLPGHALAIARRQAEREAITNQLKEDGLTNLKWLLCKGDKRHEEVHFSRKAKTKHGIILPT